MSLDAAAVADGPVRSDEPAPGVLRLRLDRGGRRNAVDRALLDGLVAALSAGDPRAVVVESADPQAFCAGIDLSLDEDTRTQLSDDLYGLYEIMLALPAPIVVALAAPAVGGGAQIALAADLRVGGPAASLRFAGPAHGLAVGAWGLPSLVGRGRAADLCLTMRTVDADEALRIGLLDRVAPDPERAALDLAVAFTGLQPAAAARVKRLTADARLLDALRAERRGNRETWSGAIPARRP